MPNSSWQGLQASQRYFVIARDCALYPFLLAQPPGEPEQPNSKTLFVSGFYESPGSKTNGSNPGDSANPDTHNPAKPGSNKGNRELTRIKILAFISVDLRFKNVIHSLILTGMANAAGVFFPMFNGCAAGMEVLAGIQRGLAQHNFDLIESGIEFSGRFPSTGIARMRNNATNEQHFYSLRCFINWG